MPLLLSVDTTSHRGSLALVRDGTVVEERRFDSPTGFDALLFPAITDLLGSQRTALADIEAFAATSGPGSFTGVRIGLTVVKGLGEVLRRPVFGISTLAALASLGTGESRAPFLDARRGAVFSALYDSRGKILTPESVQTLEAWAQRIPADGVEFLTPEPDLLGRIRSLAPIGSNWIFRQTTAYLAAPAGLLAEKRFLDGERPSPESAGANYVRRSDADLNWKDPG